MDPYTPGPAVVRRQWSVVSGDHHGGPVMWLVWVVSLGLLLSGWALLWPALHSRVIAARIGVIQATQVGGKAIERRK